MSFRPEAFDLKSWTKDLEPTMNHFRGHRSYPDPKAESVQYPKYPFPPPNNNGYNYHHHHEQSSSSSWSNAEWDRPGSSAQNWHQTEPNNGENPDGEPYEPEDEDPELNRKRKELQVIEEQILFKKASLALKTVKNVKTSKRRHFTEESEPLMERVKDILQTQSPHRFRAHQSKATSRRHPFKVQYDHPLKIRVAAALEQRFVPEELRKPEPLPFLRTPVPIQKEPSPAKEDQNRKNQGFLRFLNILNQGVDINKLKEMTTENRGVVPGSSQNGVQTDPQVIVREKLQDKDEPQKHLQNILQSLGLNLGTDEINRLGDRTQERLYGIKPSTEDDGGDGRTRRKSPSLHPTYAPTQPYPTPPSQFLSPPFPPPMNPGVYAFPGYQGTVPAYTNYWTFNQAPVPGPSKCIDPKALQAFIPARVLTTVQTTPQASTRTLISVKDKMRKRPIRIKKKKKKVFTDNDDYRIYWEKVLLNRQNARDRLIAEFEAKMSEPFETEVSGVETQRPTNLRKKHDLTIIPERFKKELTDIVDRINKYTDPIPAGPGRKRAKKVKRLVFHEVNQTQHEGGPGPGTSAQSNPKRASANEEDLVKKCRALNIAYWTVVEDVVDLEEKESEQSESEPEEPAPAPVLTEEEIKANLKKKLDAFNNRMKQKFSQQPKLSLPQKVDDEI